MSKVLRNRARCILCGHILESLSRHDFRTHGCNGPLGTKPDPRSYDEGRNTKVWFMVDGGLDYVRRGWKADTRPEDNYEELSEYSE